MNPKSEKYRSFLYVCLTFALWSLSYLILNTTLNSDFLPFFDKIANICRIIYVPFVLKFFLIFTEYYKKIKFRFLFNIIIWIFPIVFIYNNIFYSSSNYQFFIGFWNILGHIVVNLNHLTGLVFVFIWGKLSKLKREKKQSHIIIIGAILASIIGILTDFISDLLNFPVMTPSLALLFISFIFYAMVKYQFLTITPELVSKDLIENIDDSVILLDVSLKIIKINPITETLIDHKSDDINHLPISKIILEHKSITDEINNMIKENYKTFSARIHYIKNNNKNILMDVKFYILKDKYNDLIGIMLIGKQVKELKQFRSIYKITKRQEEIIRMIINGRTNKEIVETIGVAESTLKGHISNIYYKLGVNNKIELLNLLKGFNLIPEQPSEKSLLLLKRE